MTNRNQYNLLSRYNEIVDIWITVDLLQSNWRHENQLFNEWIVERNTTKSERMGRKGFWLRKTTITKNAKERWRRFLWSCSRNSEERFGMILIKDLLLFFPQPCENFFKDCFNKIKKFSNLQKILDIYSLFTRHIFEGINTHVNF